MSDTLVNQLDKYLKEGARYRAQSYTVSGDFLTRLLERLRGNEKTIEQLRKALMTGVK